MTDRSHPTDPVDGTPDESGAEAPAESSAEIPSAVPPPLTVHPAPPAAPATPSWGPPAGSDTGPTPWARRIGLAGAAAALVAVGGVGGFALGQAGDGHRDGFRPTSFQVDGEGGHGFRGGEGDHGLPPGPDGRPAPQGTPGGPGDGSGGPEDGAHT